MKLGLLADLHEDVPNLRRALERLRSHGVERVVVLGDVFDTGAAAEETAALLREAGAVGVWGNHDFGLCRNPGARARETFSAAVLDFAASLQPRLEVEDCLFTHLEPWRDPEDLLQLWGEADFPDPERLARSFAATEQRVLFTGHHHRWRLWTPEGRLDWRGEAPVRLEGGRYLVQVAAMCEEWCAVYDTTGGELIPFKV
jgi:predicted phosphodiesterase